MSTSSTVPAGVITSEGLLAHWQGHRRLSRRMIVAFPEDQLFTFSIGSMRPFGALSMEMVSMAAPFLRGVVTGTWDAAVSRDVNDRAELLRQWDASTAEIDALWRKLTPERFHETVKAFGQYEGVVSDLLLYVIDNEVHHRGQGYVYLRALGVEPPPFWERT